jgi:hypothetical protein
MADDLSDLSIDQLLDLWPGSIKGELTRRAERRGLTRSQLVKSVNKSEASGARTTSKKKLRVYFAKRDEGLSEEALDYLEGHKSFPKHRLIQTPKEEALLKEIKRDDPTYSDLSSGQRRLIDALRDYLQELRDQGLA